MLVDTALVHDPGATAIADDDRVCPGCLRPLDQPPPIWSRRRANHPWLPIVRTLFALFISGAFMVRAESAYQVALWSRSQLQRTRPVWTEDVVSRASLLREARIDALYETEETDGREATLAVAVAAVGVLGVVGAASATVGRQIQNRAAGLGCSLCAPPRRPRFSPRIAHSWRRVERHLVGLCDVLLAGYCWVLISDLLAGSPLSWHLVDASTTHILDALRSIVQL
jgi:hypothetical protein